MSAHPEPVMIAHPGGGKIAPRIAGPPALARPGNRANEVVSELLNDRRILKRAVVQCFKRTVVGDGGLSLQSLHGFKAKLSEVLDVPVHAFGDIATEFICFDFDGNGQLDVNEAYKLVKHQLLEYSKQFGGESRIRSIPFKSLSQAGYQMIKEIGRGSQGVVSLANDASMRKVCIKAFTKGRMSAPMVFDLQQEFEVMQVLACDRIARMNEIFQDASFYYMVGEVYTGGDFTTLRQRAAGCGVQMTDTWWRSIFRQCIEALAFMHEQAMIHCDIKEPNIMVKTENFHEPHVVVIDFGVARAMATAMSELKGTPGYIPPETMDMGKWFPRGDIFRGYLHRRLLQSPGNIVGDALAHAALPQVAP